MYCLLQITRERTRLWVRPQNNLKTTRGSLNVLPLTNNQSEDSSVGGTNAIESPRGAVWMYCLIQITRERTPLRVRPQNNLKTTRDS